LRLLLGPGRSPLATAVVSAFVEGQQSTSAQAEVHEYLRTTALEEDLQLKILQAVDELDRTVVIRRKFPVWQEDPGRKQKRVFAAHPGGGRAPGRQNPGLEGGALISAGPRSRRSIGRKETGDAIAT